MQWEFCHRTLEPDAPIYRVVRWDFGAFVSEVCATCCATKPHPDNPWMKGHQWRTPAPCKRCGRPVIQDLRRKPPKHIACSRKCRQAIYRAHGRSFIELQPCLHCQTPFMPKRRDVRYCSRACRQTAYRRRPFSGRAVDGMKHRKGRDDEARPPRLSPRPLVSLGWGRGLRERGWLCGRLELSQRRAQRIEPRRVGKPVVLDGAPDCRCRRGEFVVGEINCRHGPDIIGRHLSSKKRLGAFDMSKARRRDDRSPQPE
jgi:hypothetical protein